jgi:hypothetical protein
LRLYSVVKQCLWSGQKHCLNAEYSIKAVARFRFSIRQIQG